MEVSTHVDTNDLKGRFLVCGAAVTELGVQGGLLIHPTVFEVREQKLGQHIEQSTYNEGAKRNGLR
jgi:hypothetical protein